MYMLSMFNRMAYFTTIIKNHKQNITHVPIDILIKISLKWHGWSIYKDFGLALFSKQKNIRDLFLMYSWWFIIWSYTLVQHSIENGSCYQYMIFLVSYQYIFVEENIWTCINHIWFKYRPCKFDHCCHIGHAIVAWTF